jgi:hypothetical protein
MPVAVFENTTTKPLTFVVEPNNERYEIPVLARVGVRYAFEDGVVDRTFADVGEGMIRFWCDSQSREVELVYPTPFDLLLRDVCVRLGFCGGLVNGKPTHVTGLLPVTGIVTAEAFARLVISAECDQGSSPDKALRWTDLLVASFIEHLGAESAPAGSLVQNLAQPFEQGQESEVSLGSKADLQL